MKIKLHVLMTIGLLALFSCQNNPTNTDKEGAEAIEVTTTQDGVMDENKVAQVVEINEEDSVFIKEYATSKYLGFYGFNFSEKLEGNTGSLLIYPESDTSVLFNLEVCIGAPSFNLGMATGRLIIKNDTALYQPAEYNSTCKIIFYFRGNEIQLKTIDGFSECGFANNVYADAIYKLEKKVTPKYYDPIDGYNYFRDFK
jgi:hypothetical protein